MTCRPDRGWASYTPSPTRAALMHAKAQSLVCTFVAVPLLYQGKGLAWLARTGCSNHFWHSSRHTTQTGVRTPYSFLAHSLLRGARGVT